MKKTKKYLGVETKPKNASKYVGVVVPLHTYNYINLYSLAFGETKSKIFKRIIEDWINSENFEGELLTILSQRINEQWMNNKEKHPKASFSKFKNSIQSELMNKGLRIKQINVIMENIKE